MNGESDDDVKILDVLKRQKIENEPESKTEPVLDSKVTPEPTTEPTTTSLLAEIENVPVVNLDSSLDSNCSREESKAANNDKELFIDSNNSDALFHSVKEKYVRPYPEHAQPAIQELLAKLNETDVRMFKFINDSGLYSDDSILGLLDLEKRIIKQNKINNKGKMKLTRLTEEERAELKPEDTVYARWIVQERDKDRDAMFYPAIITEKTKLYLDETDMIERKLRQWNLLEDRHLTETLIKEISNLDSMIDVMDEIEYMTKRLVSEGQRANANGTAIASGGQQEIVDHGSICKHYLGINNRFLADRAQCLTSKESLLEFLESAKFEQPDKVANGVDAFADFI